MYDSKLGVLKIVLLINLLSSSPIICEENGNSVPKNADPQYNSFIAVRMKHLTAVNELKQVKNAVKQHQLVLNLFKKTFKVVDENRKIVAGIQSRANMPKDAAYVVVNYLENIAFFCDLLVFFPEITAKHLEANLLWRVTLIDSIQDAIAFNVNFVDDATQAQFEKAYTVLTEGPTEPVESNKPPAEKKHSEPKKTKRKPRLTSNEL